MAVRVSTTVWLMPGRVSSCPSAAAARRVGRHPRGDVVVDPEMRRAGESARRWRRRATDRPSARGRRAVPAWCASRMHVTSWSRVMSAESITTASPRAWATHRGRHQRAGVDDHVGRRDQVTPAQGQEVRRTRTCTDEMHRHGWAPPPPLVGWPPRGLQPLSFVGRTSAGTIGCRVMRLSPETSASIRGRVDCRAVVPVLEAAGAASLGGRASRPQRAAGPPHGQAGGTPALPGNTITPGAALLHDVISWRAARIEQHMDVVGHDDPRQQTGAFAVEVQQRVRHDLGDAVVSQPARAVTLFGVAFDSLAQLRGAGLVQPFPPEDAENQAESIGHPFGVHETNLSD